MNNMKNTISNLKRLFWEDWKKLLLLNVLTVICSLPVVTIGPAILALNGTLIRMIDDRCGLSIVNEFATIFKAKFWRGIIFEALTASYVFFVIWGIAAADVMDGTIQSVMVICLIATIVLSSMVSVYLVPLLADSKIAFANAVWTAVGVAIARLPKTLLAIFGAYGVILVFMTLYPISLLLYAVALLSTSAAIMVSVVWPVLEELLFSEESTQLIHAEE